MNRQAPSQMELANAIIFLPHGFNKGITPAAEFSYEIND